MSRLIARAHGQLPALSPRLPGRFEPIRDAEPYAFEFAGEPGDAAELPAATQPSPTAPEMATAEFSAGFRRPEISAREEPREPRPAGDVRPIEGRAANVTQAWTSASEDVHPPGAAASSRRTTSGSARFVATGAVEHAEPPKESGQRRELETSIVSSAQPTAPAWEALGEPTRSGDAPDSDRADPPQVASRAIAATAPRPPSLRAAPEEDPAAEPRVVHVTIGRVEVRAAAPALVKQPPVAAAKPRVSLDDYLARPRRR